MRMHKNLASGVAVTALALSACGIAVGGSPGAAVRAAALTLARHALVDTGSAGMRDMARVKREAVSGAVQRTRAHLARTDAAVAGLHDLAQAKRDAERNAIQRARAHQPQASTAVAGLHDLAQAKRDAEQNAIQRARAHSMRGRPAPSSDSGLQGCATLSGALHAAAIGYPAITAQFAGSRWPDLRSSGLAYVGLLATHAYRGGTILFYQRLATACAEHGRPLPF
jgi:hypothetical protein